MQLRTFLLHQKKMIEEYKWVESQKAGRDLGEEAVQQWVNKFGAQYRKEYEEIFNEIVKETADKCKDKLKCKMPTVSEEIWDFFFIEVIKSFTEIWTKDLILCKDKYKKDHLEEI